MGTELPSRLLQKTFITGFKGKVHTLGAIPRTSHSEGPQKGHPCSRASVRCFSQLSSILRRSQTVPLQLSDLK